MIIVFDPRDRVLVANLIGPSIIQRVLRVILVMFAQSHDHGRNTVIEDASEDSLGCSAQFRGGGSGGLQPLLSQHHQRPHVAKQ